MKRRRETVEMADHRVYVSDDNWRTVFLRVSEGLLEQITGKEADLVRFLAVSQSSWQGDAF